MGLLDEALAEIGDEPEGSVLDPALAEIGEPKPAGPVFVQTDVSKITPRDRVLPKRWSEEPPAPVTPTAPVPQPVSPAVRPSLTPEQARAIETGAVPTLPAEVRPIDPILRAAGLTRGPEGGLVPDTRAAMRAAARDTAEPTISAATTQARPDVPPEYVTGPLGPGESFADDRATHWRNGMPMTPAQRTYIKALRANRAVADVAGGLGSVVAGAIHMIPWAEALAGIDTPLGTVSKAAARRAESVVEQITPEDPNLLDKFASGLGSTLPFFGAGKAAEIGVRAIGAAAPRLAKWVGASAMAVTEGGTEAGMLFNELVRSGVDPAEAARRANWTFGMNLALLTATNKAGVFAETGGVVRRGTRGAAAEAAQEGAQEVISTAQTPASVTERGTVPGSGIVTPEKLRQYGEAALIGGAVGGTIGGAVGLADRSSAPRRPRVTEPARPAPAPTPALDQARAGLAAAQDELAQERQRAADLVARGAPATPAETPAAKPAPVVFAGWQNLRGTAIPLYHLTADIPGHPEGSTLFGTTLTGEGYAVPDPPGPAPVIPPRLTQPNAPEGKPAAEVVAPSVTPAVTPEPPAVTAPVTAAAPDRPAIVAAPEGVLDAALAEVPEPTPEVAPEVTPEVELDDGALMALGEMATELEVAAPGRRIRTRRTDARRGKVEEWVAQPSTYPEWMAPSWDTRARTRQEADRLLDEIRRFFGGEPAKDQTTRAFLLNEARRQAPDAERILEREARETVEPVDEPEALSEPAAQALDVGVEAAEGTPERAAYLELKDWIEETVAAAGDPETALTRLLAAGEDAVSETAGRFGRPLRLTRAERIDVLRQTYPELQEADGLERTPATEAPAPDEAPRGLPAVAEGRGGRAASAPAAEGPAAPVDERPQDDDVASSQDIARSALGPDEDPAIQLRLVARLHQAAGRAVVIPGQRQRLLDSGFRFTEEEVAELAQAEYVRALSAGLESALVAAHRVVAQRFPNTQSADLFGLDLGTEEHGVNIRADILGATRNQIILNVWATAQSEVLDHLDVGRLEADDALWVFVERLRDNIAHELTHQIERGHGVRFNEINRLIRSSLERERDVVESPILAALQGDSEHEQHLRDLFNDARRLRAMEPREVEGAGEGEAGPDGGIVRAAQRRGRPIRASRGARPGDRAEGDRGTRDPVVSRAEPPDGKTQPADVARPLGRGPAPDVAFEEPLTPRPDLSTPEGQQQFARDLLATMADALGQAAGRPATKPVRPDTPLTAPVGPAAPAAKPDATVPGVSRGRGPGAQEPTPSQPPEPESGIRFARVERAGGLRWEPVRASGEPIPASVTFEPASEGRPASWRLDATDRNEGRTGAHSLAWAKFSLDGEPLSQGSDWLTTPTAIQLADFEAVARAMAARWEGREHELASPGFIRFGDLPRGGRSLNHATGKLERGVSVFTAHRNPFSGALELADDPGVLSAANIQAAFGLYGDVALHVHGKVVGRGGDGEPVLSDVAVVGRLRYDPSVGGHVPSDRPEFPGAPSAPVRIEPTPEGEQVVIGDTPARTVPSTRLRPEAPQRPVEETPLFGQEQADRERASDAAQGGLFDAAEEAPRGEESQPPDTVREDPADYEPRSVEPAPAFYSALRETIKTRMQSAAVAPLVRNLVRAGGVKADEIAWSGLDEWLEAKGGAKVTRDEVLAFLDQNAVRVEEVVKESRVNQKRLASLESELADAEREVEAAQSGAAPGVKPGDRVASVGSAPSRGGYSYSTGVVYEATPRQRDGALIWRRVGTFGGTRSGRSARFVTELKESAQFPWSDTAGHNLEIPAEHRAIPGELLARVARLRASLERIRTGLDTTKFSRFTLPGAEPGSYRELLLTLPMENAGKWEVFDPVDGTPLRAFDTQAEAHAFLREHERGASLDVAHAGEGFARGRGPYRSPHWDEPNVLAHIRFDERTTADGQRVMHVAELQSDWGQSLRSARALRQLRQPQRVRKLAEDLFGAEMAAAMPLEQVDGGVLAALHHNEVRRAVISRLPVNVVNNLAAVQATPENLFRHPDVIVSRLAIDHRRAVARGVLSGARDVAASLRAKLLLALEAGRDVELFPALRASDLTAREVVGALAPYSLYHAEVSREAVSERGASPRAEVASAPEFAELNPEGPPASDAEFLDRPIAARLGTKADGRQTTHPHGERGPARIAEALDWHNKIVSAAGSRKTVRYKPSDVPDMPLSGVWAETAFRRAVRWAAERGLDAVTWDPGSVQAERYDLSKYVDAVEWNEGTGDFYAGKGADAAIRRQGVKAADLPDLIGKDIADRLASQTPHTNGNRILRGLDLKVGGEGMRGFYDTILVDYANKFGKRWGARVESARIRTDNAPDDVVARYADQPDHPFTKRQFATVHVIPITPSMRRSVLTEGVALFESRRRYTRRREADPATQQKAEQLSLDAIGDLARTIDQVATPPQRGAAGQDAPRPDDAVPAVGVPLRLDAPGGGGGARSPVRTLGLGFVADLADTGHLTLLGQSLPEDSPAALAVLLQPVRNPKFETFRVFLVRGTEVVGEEVTTTRLPDVTPLPWGFFGTTEQAREWAREFVARALARGATGFWMTHNHPSGTPKPSEPDDLSATRRMRDLVADEARSQGVALDFRGHVIIDSGTYGFIAPDLATSVDALPGAFLPDPLLRPTVPHEVLGAYVGTAADVARVGAALKQSADYVSLVFTGTASGTVRAVADLPVSAFGDPASAADLIRQAALGYGSGRVFAYYEGVGGRTDRAWSTGQALVRDGVLTDFVLRADEVLSAAEVEEPPRDKGRVLGARLDTFRQETAVREEPPPYRAETPAAVAEPTVPYESEGRATLRMAQRLRERGFTGEEIARMTPAEARAFLAATPPTRETGAGAAGTPPPVEPPPRATGGPDDVPPEPPAARWEGSAGSGLAEIAAMNRRAKTPRRVLDVLRAVKDRLITAQVNKFHPVEMELARAGVPHEQIVAVMRTLELTHNKIAGQTEVFAYDLGDAYKRMLHGPNGRDLTEAWNAYLTLAQFEKRIRDLAARPDSGVSPEGHRTDAGQERLGEGTGSRYVNPLGFDMEKIRLERARLRKSLGLKDWQAVERAARDVWAANRKLLDRAHAAGIVSDEAYEAMTARGEDYVPIQVLDYVNESGETLAAGRPYSVRYQDFLKRMEGTERDVRNVIDASMDKATRTIALINRNLAAKAVADLAPEFPGLITQIPGDTFLVPDGRKVLSVFEGGHRQNYAVPEEIERAMKFLDAEHIGVIGSILRAASTPLKAGATGMNLGFALFSNPPRDIARAWSRSAYGMSPVDWARGISQAWLGVQSPLYREALESGALTTFQRTTTPEAFMRRASGLPEPPYASRAEAVLKAPRDILRFLIAHTARVANLTEEGTKMATYLRGTRQGATGPALAYEVANYGGSPNFSRNGTIGPEMNLLWMFYNARLQGTAADIRRYRETPSTLGKRAALRTAVYVVLPTLAAWALAWFYDEEDKALGIQGPSRPERQRNWIIPMPYVYQAADGTMRRAYVKIAKDESAQVLGGALESSLDWLAERDPETVRKIGLDTLGNLSPISFDIEGEPPTAADVLRGVGSGVLAGLNPLFRLPVETGLDYNARFQGPIVPRGLADRVLPQDQARPMTSPTVINLARLFAEAGLPEPLSNPIKLEYIITSGTGGLGQSVLDAIDRAQGKSLPEVVGEYEGLTRMPGFSRVLGRGGDAENRRAEDRFYRVYQDAQRTAGSLTLAGERAPTAPSPRLVEIASDTPSRVKVEMLEDFRDLAGELGDIRKAQGFVTHHLDAPVETKRLALRALATRRDALLRAFEFLEERTRGFTEPLARESAGR